MRDYELLTLPFTSDEDTLIKLRDFPQSSTVDDGAQDEVERDGAVKSLGIDSSFQQVRYVQLRSSHKWRHGLLDATSWRLVRSMGSAERLLSTLLGSTTAATSC